MKFPCALRSVALQLIKSLKDSAATVSAPFCVFVLVNERNNAIKKKCKAVTLYNDYTALR